MSAVAEVLQFPCTIGGVIAWGITDMDAGEIVTRNAKVQALVARAMGTSSEQV
jgi:hypothetical protein